MVATKKKNWALVKLQKPNTMEEGNQPLGYSDGGTPAPQRTPGAYFVRVSKVVPVLNKAPRHEDVWESGSTAPRILNLRTRSR